MAIHTIELKNTTSSGISISDLAGLYIPASGTVDVTELFPTYKLYESEILDDHITNNDIVLCAAGYDLTPTRAQRFISPHDATSIQGFPIGHSLGTQQITVSSGIAEVLLYDHDSDTVFFNGISFDDLAGITIIGGSYYITTQSGVQIPISQGFIELTDTPSTYEGSLGYLLYVTSSGVQFIDPLEAGGQHEFFRYAADETTTYTTSQTYVDKLTLTVSGVEPGIYRTNWYFEYNYANSSFAMYSSVTFDHTETLSETAHRVSNSADWYSTSGFGYVTVTSGTHFVDLMYRSDKPNTSAGMRRARLELRRISDE